MIDRQIPQERFEFLWVLVYSVTLIFSMRLINIQLLMHSYYRDIAEKNRTQVISQAAPRGRIFTSDDTAVATNKPSFSLIYFPGQVKDPVYFDKISRGLSAQVGLPPEDIRSSLIKSAKRGAPVRLAENLSSKSMFALSELKTIYPGVDIIVEAKRYYPFGGYLSHLIGYISKMDAKEWAFYSKNRGYAMDDRVGKAGLEKMYEKELRGEDGGIYLEVDSRGKLKRILESKKWIPGDDIYLTIDSKAQTAAEEGLEKSLSGKGAVVAIDPRNGALLALASMPDYDPNIFVSYSDEKEDLKVSSLPEFNVAIQGAYPPGSIFKIISSIAALESGRFSSSERYFCPGFFDAGSRIFKCWEKIKGHGDVDFLTALAKSCDVYYYNLGIKTGPLFIEKYAKAFHLGMPTGIALPDEKSGNVFGPTKRAAKKSYWFIGDTLNLSIGQGETLVTPMQMVVYMAAVANKGTLWKPYYVNKIISPAGEVVFKGASEKTGEVRLKDSTWSIVEDGIRRVVTEGTGQIAAIKGVDVFGKTGTAQNPQGKDHAWFIAYAKINNEPSQVAVAVLVEHGEHGASSAAPIAKNVIMAVLRDRLKPAAAPAAVKTEGASAPLIPQTTGINI